MVEIARIITFSNINRNNMNWRRRLKLMDIKKQRLPWVKFIYLLSLKHKPNVVEFVNIGPINWDPEFYLKFFHLKARNYLVEGLVNFKVKLIDDKIIPEIGTTNTVIVGEISM